MSGKGAKGLSGKGAKGTMGDKKGDKKKPTSRSARAGLQFPVGRIHRLLKVSRPRRHLQQASFNSSLLLLFVCYCERSQPMPHAMLSSPGSRDCQWTCGSHGSRLHSSYSW